MLSQSTQSTLLTANRHHFDCPRNFGGNRECLGVSLRCPRIFWGLSKVFLNVWRCLAVSFGIWRCLVSWGVFWCTCVIFWDVFANQGCIYGLTPCGIMSGWSKTHHFGTTLKDRIFVTWSTWENKIPKPPNIRFPKIIGFVQFLIFLDSVLAIGKCVSLGLFNDGAAAAGGITYSRS